MKKILVLFTFLALFAVNAAADIPMPGKPKPTAAVQSPKTKEVSGSLLIQIDPNAKEAVLRLNRNQVRELRAALDDAADEGDETAAAGGGFGFTRLQTVVSGLFLSLAIVFGGVWLKRSKPSKTVAGLVLLAFVGTGAMLVYANAGPPGSLRSLTSRMFSSDMKGWRRGRGSVKIQVVNQNAMDDRSNAVELIVPQAEEDRRSE